jgi:hypothetical protein
MEVAMFDRVLTVTLRMAGAACLVVVFAIGAQVADKVRYVSVTGSDANKCTLAAPCRNLGRGINRTPVDGELRVLDSGDYGTNAKINKSMTLSGNGHTIVVANGIVIDNAVAVGPP